MSPSATRRRSAAALLLLVAFCCIVRDAAAAAGPVITSVSGCVDVGATTVNCSLPVLLTVRGSGFLTGIASAGSFYQGAPIYYINPQPAFSPQAVQAGWVRPYLKAYYGTPCNDTHFVFQLVNLGRGVFLTDTLIGLSVLLSADSLTAGILSEPFLGLSIASLPQPSIASISGCVTAADGLSVSQCLPDLHPLTVMGSGFLAWQLTPLLLVIGTTSSGLTVQLGGDSPRWSSMVNDSCLYISLAVDYRYLVAAGDFGAPPLTFAIKERVTGWSSRTLHIQFDALPLPTYQAIVPFNFYTNLLPSCQWGPNQTTIVNCTAGGSGFRISGHYLYDVVATIGGQPCTLMTYGQQDTLYSSQTTPLYNYEPGVLYDLTFSNPAGSVTVPRFISFSGAPYIVSGACRDPTLPTDIGSLGCQVAETLLLNGPNLPPPSTPFTVTLFSRASQSNVSCANPRYTSATQLACDVLMPGLPAVGGWDAQYVRWSTGQTLTINNRFDAWDGPVRAPHHRRVLHRLRRARQQRRAHSERLHGRRSADLVRQPLPVGGVESGHRAGHAGPELPHQLPPPHHDGPGPPRARRRHRAVRAAQAGRHAAAALRRAADDVPVERHHVGPQQRALPHHRVLDDAGRRLVVVEHGTDRRRCSARHRGVGRRDSGSLLPPSSSGWRAVETEAAGRPEMTTSQSEGRSSWFQLSEQHA